MLLLNPYEEQRILITALVFHNGETFILKLIKDDEKQLLSTMSINDLNLNITCEIIAITN
ncbi:MAG: hypothetical protein KAS57_07970 [Gammaproteobacteria bacterium]|nr:hypothetical protein [Gammaproteobacteria bacterium]